MPVPTHNPKLDAYAGQAEDFAKPIESKSASFQKEYKVWIGEAKTDATRDKRIEEAMAWIAEGKGRFWKHAKS